MILGCALSDRPDCAARRPSPTISRRSLFWRTATIFSERERIAIEFADRMGQEPKSLAQDEAFWQRAHAHFSDKEIVDLTFSVASWIALGRMTHVLGLDTTCAIAPARDVA